MVATGRKPDAGVFNALILTVSTSNNITNPIATRKIASVSPVEPEHYRATTTLKPRSAHRAHVVQMRNRLSPTIIMQLKLRAHVHVSNTTNAP